MTSRKVKDQVDAAPARSEKDLLKEAQEILDDVRSRVKQHGFTPEQVFGYYGEASLANLIAEVHSPSEGKTTAKKVAAKKAPSRAGATKVTTVKQTGKRVPAKKVAPPEEASAPSPVKTALDSACWPFPTGHR